MQCTIAQLVLTKAMTDQRAFPSFRTEGRMLQRSTRNMSRVIQIKCLTLADQ